MCPKTSLSCHYTLCFCIKQYNFHLLIYSQQPVVRHFTTRDIYRIFHELQRSLKRLQHRYYDVTILMVWHFVCHPVLAVNFCNTHVFLSQTFIFWFWSYEALSKIHPPYMPLLELVVMPYFTSWHFSQNREGNFRYIDHRMMLGKLYLVM